MSNIVNTSTLVRLADKDLEQAVVDFGSLPLDIKESLNRQQAERRKEVVDAAASEIVNLLQLKDAFVQTNVQLIQSKEREIVALKAVLSEADRATKYGLATQNFLPLTKQLGLPLPTNLKDGLKVIPKDWTEPVAAPFTETATQGSD